MFCMAAILKSKMAAGSCDLKKCFHKKNVLWGLIYHCANFHTSTQNCRVFPLRSLTNCDISCKFVKFTRFLKLRVRGNIMVFYTQMEYTTHAYYISLDREMNEEHFDMQ